MIQMPLIRNKKALKAHIKAYLTPFCAQYGLLEVEDIKTLSQRFSEEEQLEGVERSSFSLPPLPLDEEVVAVLLHKGVVEWLKEQHASADVLQQVMALMPARKEPAASTASLSSVNGRVSKQQTQSEDIIGPSPTSTSSFSFSALRQRLRETRDQMEKIQAQGVISNVAGGSNDEKEKGEKTDISNRSCSSGLEGKKGRMEFQSTEDKTKKVEREETIESERDLKEEGSDILIRKKTRGWENMSEAPLGSTTVTHMEGEIEKYSTKKFSPDFVFDNLERKPSRTHSSMENFASEVLENDKGAQEQAAGEVRLSPSFPTADFTPLDASKDEPMKKKNRNENRKENDGVSEIKDVEGGERKKRVKELLSLSPVLSNSPAQPQQSSTRRIESQSVFHLTPLNDDELFDSIPLPPPPPAAANSYYHHPHGYPPHSHQFHAPVPSTYSHWNPTHVAPPPFNSVPPHASSFSYSSAPNPRADPLFESPPEPYRHQHGNLHQYSPYNAGGETNAGRSDERGGTTGYPPTSSDTYSYPHVNGQGAGGVDSFW